MGTLVTASKLLGQVPFPEVLVNFDGMLSMLVGSALVFGLPHATSAIEGASVGWAVFQALVAGVYFGLAYILTDSLAFPIALHFSTNLWVASVFGMPDSAFPALLRIERNLQADPKGVMTMLLPAIVLIGLIIGWVSLTRDEFSVADSLSKLPEDALNERTAD
ncbi:CPBP family glutamic-type intramembrane protease [Halobacterium salinarum]|uniref:CPBP family glutamic-type intramembrane protease n=1 Tax=Halobacterium salinarum TaxID=2242 RepID=UPI00298C4A7B|nr:CPBP family intramembrane glutamic endopeptidase [Halobacterium salinarum]WJK64810.1 CPBP family intramembrane glutamic endopeptidase [Halobacterium salinarum]